MSSYDFVNAYIPFYYVLKSDNSICNNITWSGIMKRKLKRRAEKNHNFYNHTSMGDTECQSKSRKYGTIRYREITWKNSFNKLMHVSCCAVDYKKQIPFLRYNNSIKSKILNMVIFANIFKVLYSKSSIYIT